MKYLCKTCGKEFIRYDNRRKNLYCCKECAAKGRTKVAKIHLNCDYCGKEFIRKVNTLRGKNYFCSNECANNYQKRNKIKFICKTCGNEFYKPKSWIKQKKGLYCSMRCRNNDEEWKKKSCYKANAIQNKKKNTK